MDAAYDPELVHELHWRTAQTIDALSQLRSGDPAAIDALRILRLARRNLEDQWMPALRDIENSDAMVSWRASRLPPLTRSTIDGALPDHLRPGGLAPFGPLTEERLASLLGELAWLERKSYTPEGAPVDARGRPTDGQLDQLARDLAFWIPRDGRLRDAVIALAPTNLLVGELLGRAAFPSAFVSAVITTMATPNGPDDGGNRDRYAASMSAALRALVRDPGACLDLLVNEPTVLHALAGFERLDPAAVTEFVVTGLHVAVQLEPTRLDDGYRVLQTLTMLANGPLDRAVAPAMAVGVASSMPTYIDGLAIAVNSTRDDSLFIVTDRPRNVDVSFGRYRDVVGLFGVLLREQEARAVFGSTTADWTAQELEAATSPDALDAALTTSAQFTQLLVDAGASEQQQMASEAAETEERKRAVGRLALTGADAAMTAYHVPGAVRAPLRTIADSAVRWIARTEPEMMPGRSIGPEIHRQMIVTAVSIGMSTPGVFSDTDTDRAAAATLTPAQRRTIEADLAAIEAEDDSERREVLVNAMADHVQAHVPALAPALRLVSNNVAVAALDRTP
jgi:hypothetical protein